MPHSFSLAVSMNLEHSIKEESHERYPVHLQCLGNIKKIKYPDFQAMTPASVNCVKSAKITKLREWCEFCIILPVGVEILEKLGWIAWISRSSGQGLAN